MCTVNMYMLFYVNVNLMDFQGFIFHKLWHDYDIIVYSDS